MDQNVIVQLLWVRQKIEINDGDDIKIQVCEVFLLLASKQSVRLCLVKKMHFCLKNR